MCRSQSGTAVRRSLRHAFYKYNSGRSLPLVIKRGSHRTALSGVRTAWCGRTVLYRARWSSCAYSHVSLGPVLSEIAISFHNSAGPGCFGHVIQTCLCAIVSGILLIGGYTHPCSFWRKTKVAFRRHGCNTWRRRLTFETTCSGPVLKGRPKGNHSTCAVLLKAWAHASPFSQEVLARKRGAAQELVLSLRSHSAPP